ncbi:MAG: lipopolysaccharide heptosyltransferase II [Candidatus Omnitrophica bacterium]|nr:lipopolysaccharide heptosyltransferase II [Candidatus Omnitrophota bacterium]
MNILQILPELNVGGVETGTVDMARYLAAHGHKSIVVSNGGGLVEVLETQGCKHYTLPVHKKNLFTMFRCISKLVAIINYEKIDIVHARSRVPAWIAFFACRRTQAHFVTTCHGYYSRHLFSRVMGWGKLVIAISDVIGRHMVEDLATPAENIRVIARSVDVEKFNLPRTPKTPSDPMTVVMISRITPLKGHAYFIKAMGHVINQMPSVKVQLIGDAPAKKQAYKDELVLLVKRLGIEEQVEFLGNRRDIPELLSKADCLVLSTVTHEAFGRVIIEAQAAGVPVVATRVGGVAEIIDHEKTGLLVLPKDADGISRAVLRILKDPALAAGFVLEAKKKIEDRYTLVKMADATVAVYQELMQTMKILIIKLTAVGDVVLTTAAFAAIRNKFPNAQIFCLTSYEASAIVQNCPHLNGTIVVNPKAKRLPELWRMSQELRRYHFDKVVDLQNNRTSHLLAFLAMAHESYGYNNGKFAFLLSRKLDNDIRNIPPVEHQFRILKMLNINYDANVRLKLWPSAKDEAYVQSLLDSEWLSGSQIFVGLNVSASKQWPTKNWPLEYIAKLCDILGQKNIRLILTGENKDKALVRKILHKAHAKPANFAGKTTILQLAALVKRCRVYISMDSAPLHVAAAMQVPVIAFFGPTDFRRHMPPSDRFVVLHKPMKCSPCYSSICKIKTHACMNDIVPEEVARQVIQLIK